MILLASLIIGSLIVISNSMDENTTQIVSTRLTVTETEEAEKSTTSASNSAQSANLSQGVLCSADICAKLCPRAYFSCDGTLTACICRNSANYTKTDESCEQIKSQNSTEWPPYTNPTEVTALYLTCERVTKQIAFFGYYDPKLYVCKASETSSMNYGVCYFHNDDYHYSLNN